VVRKYTGATAPKDAIECDWHVFITEQVDASFCPIGPWLVTDLDPKNLSIKLTLNGETRQNSLTSVMIFPVAKLVSFISEIMTLNPGDTILTGTPAGIGALNVGDVISVVEIGAIGILTNQVAESGVKNIIDKY